MTKEIIILIIIVYLVSCILWYRYVSIAFSDKGIFSSQKTGTSEILIMFTPMVNTFFCLYGYILHYPKKGEKRDTSNFFKIKQ